MAWIKIFDTLREHPKTYALADRLRIEQYAAGGIVVFLWTWALQNAVDGDVSRFPDVAIARACFWQKKPSELMDALYSCGWLDEDSRFHDWAQYTGVFQEKQDAVKAANRERQRAYRERKSSDPVTQDVTQSNVTSRCDSALRSISVMRDKVLRDAPVTEDVTRDKALQQKPITQDVTQSNAPRIDKIREDKKRITVAANTVTEALHVTPPPPPTTELSQQRNTLQHPLRDDVLQHDVTLSQSDHESRPCDVSQLPSQDISAAVRACREYIPAMTDRAFQELADFQEQGLPDDLICYAVNGACDNGSPRWAYVSKILNTYLCSGIRTVEQAKERDRRHQAAKGSTQAPKAAELSTDAKWGGEL